jgi:phage-related holin
MGYLVAFYFICMDFFTGLLKAFATDAFSSRVMRRGLFHKGSLLCVLALGYLMDYAQRYLDLGVAVPVGAAACVYIVLMETGSTLENLCETNPELMPERLCEVFGVKGEPSQSPMGTAPPSGTLSVPFEDSSPRGGAKSGGDGEGAKKEESE